MKDTITIKDIRLRTQPGKSSVAQDIIVSIITKSGKEVDVIKEFGACSDITISHYVTAGGMQDRIDK